MSESRQRYETVAVPFVMVGNRRGLTCQQLAEHDYLRDFVERFPQSFERDLVFDVWLFVEPEEPQSTQERAA